MTILVSLQPIPNQTVSAPLEDNRYELTLKATGSVMAVDITRDNIRLMTGARVVAGTPLLPYPYQEIGNFIFTTDNDDLPDYRQFGGNHRLIYITRAEVESVRNG